MTIEDEKKKRRLAAARAIFGKQEEKAGGDCSSSGSSSSSSSKCDRRSKKKQSNLSRSTSRDKRSRSRSLAKKKSKPKGSRSRSRSRRRSDSRKSVRNRKREKSATKDRKGTRKRSASKNSGKLSKSEKLWERIESMQMSGGRSSPSYGRSASRESRARAMDKREKERLHRRWERKLREGFRGESLRIALDLARQPHTELPQHLLQEMLELAASRPGLEVFAQILSVCAIARLRLEAQAFARVMGLLMHRDAPLVQIRLFLNVLVATYDEPIPLLPPDMGGLEEISTLFQEESGASHSDDESEKAGNKSVAERLEFKNCHAYPDLNGVYELEPDVTSYGRPSYRYATELASFEIFYRRTGKDSTGWYIGRGPDSDALVFNSSESRQPPRTGWQAIRVGGNGVRKADPATLVLPNSTYDTPSSSEDNEKALKRVDLRRLQDMVVHKDDNVRNYFCHFSMLLHLEYLTEVMSIRHRRQRSPLEQLVRTGWALVGLPVKAIFGRRDGGSGRKPLPGWQDTGTEMVAFVLPPGFDSERIRFSKGDSVTLSERNPLTDRVAEGLVQDVKQNSIVIQINGKMSDHKGKVWRLDKAPNRVTYERQFLALLQMASTHSQPPCSDVLVTARVGDVDEWAQELGARSDNNNNNNRSCDKSPPARQRTKSESGSRSRSRERKQKRNAAIECAKLAAAKPKVFDKAILEKATAEAKELTKLNQSQRDAVTAALGRTCTIIQGPPGTGKTHVSVEILRMWAKSLDASPLLAASDSNIAVDNIAAGLHAVGIKAVRIGRVEKVHGHLQEITLEAQLRLAKEKDKEKDKDSLADGDQQESKEQPTSKEVSNHAVERDHTTKSDDKSTSGWQWPNGTKGQAKGDWERLSCAGGCLKGKGFNYSSTDEKGKYGVEMKGNGDWDCTPGGNFFGMKGKAALGKYSADYSYWWMGGDMGWGAGPFGKAGAAGGYWSGPMKGGWRGCLAYGMDSKGKLGYGKWTKDEWSQDDWSYNEETNLGGEFLGKGRLGYGKWTKDEWSYNEESNHGGELLGKGKLGYGKRTKDEWSYNGEAKLGEDLLGKGKDNTITSLGGELSGKGKSNSKTNVGGDFMGKSKGGNAGKTAEVDLEVEHENLRRNNRLDFDLQMKILREAEVICTTTVSAGGDFLSKIQFAGILIDEVAQATELSAIVPVVLRGGSCLKRLVLVGDHCQLPPGIASPEAEKRGLSLSIYSRLQRSGVEPFLLDTQYRSHPKIMEFSSQAFYGNALRNGIDSEARPPPRGVSWPSANVPVAFFEVGATEESEGDSKLNPTEASRVVQFLAEVLGAGELTLDQIGVVTPYSAQVRRLRQLLRQIIPRGTDPRSLECASVDAFQGREKELMIFSAVRSNSRRNVGFLSDWRRLNVMLTRARRGLVVFGTSGTLVADPTWRKWLSWCLENGAILGGSDTIPGLTRLLEDAENGRVDLPHRSLAKSPDSPAQSVSLSPVRRRDSSSSSSSSSSSPGRRAKRAAARQTISQFDQTKGAKQEDAELIESAEEDLVVVTSLASTGNLKSSQHDAGTHMEIAAAGSVKKGIDEIDLT